MRKLLLTLIAMLLSVVAMANAKSVQPQTDGHNLANIPNSNVMYSAVGVAPEEPPVNNYKDYVISTPAHLLWLMLNYNNGSINKDMTHVHLDADISLRDVCHPASGNMTMVSWEGIGTADHPFKGSFHGHGHKITDLYINSHDPYSGFIAITDRATRIDTLDIEGTIVNHNSKHAGMIVGKLDNASILSCTSRGTIRASGHVGGITGTSYYGGISNCANYAEVINVGLGDEQNNPITGGIVGHARDNNYITKCSNYGNVSCINTERTDARTAGIVGYINWTNLLNCYVDKRVTITASTGRAAGVVADGSLDSKLKNIYSAATVIASSGPAALLSTIINDGYTATNCWYDASARLVIAGEEKNGKRGYVTVRQSLEIEEASAEDIASGRVCWNLQEGQDVFCWGQNLSDPKSCPHLTTDEAERVVRYTERNCAGDLAVSYINGTEDVGSDNVLPHVENHVTGFCSICGFPVAQPEGTGTKADPYRIGNIAQLYNYALKVNGATATSDAVLKSYAVLTADIDLALYASTWAPMGTDAYPYAGHFDGNGYKITGFTVRNADGGLFYSLNGATVKNVDITADILNDADSGKRSAIIATVADASTITGCTTRGSIQGPIVGGVVMQSQGKSSIIDCTNYATITGKSYVGGIATAALNGKIERCVNMGNVTGSLDLGDTSDSFVGGIVARLRTSSDGALDITDCISYGTLSARTACGGIVGRSQSTSSVNIIRCVAMGDVFQLPGAGGTYGQTAAFGRFYGETYTGATAPVVSQGYYYKTSQLVLRGANQTAAATEKGATAITASDFTRTVSTLNSEQCGHWTTEARMKVGSATLRDVPMVSATVVHNFPDATGPCYCGEGIHKDDEGYYLIGTAKQLAAFRDLVNSATAADGAINARQTADIDMYEVCHPAITKPKTPKLSWEPIGNGNWWGTYDGQGHKLTNLYYSDADNHGGLFGQIGTPYNIVRSTYTRICNLSVEGNVSVTANTTEGAQGAAILCAVNYGGTIENCQTAGRVYSQAPNVGGLVGYSRGVLSCCRNTAEVEGTEPNVGGLIGQLDSYVTGNGVEYCANTTGVKGVSAVGGLVGKVNGSGSICSSYNTANVTTASASKSTVQPIVGLAPNGYTTENCYYDIAMMSDGQQELYGGNGLLTTAFTNGRVACLLGEPWGQNIGADATAKETVPYLMSYPVYEDGSKLTNFFPSIYGLTKLIDLSRRGGRISLQGIEAQRQHILTK